MKGKNIKLHQVEAAEKAFFANADALDLFYKLFHHSHQGAAITDINGKIICTNASFVKLVSQAPVYIDLPQLLSQIDVKDGVTETLVDTGKGTLKMSLVPLADKPGGARWLWMASVEKETRAQEKLISLKNLYRSFIDNTFELVFRTSQEDTLVFSNRLFILSFGFDSYSKAKGNVASSVFENPDTYRNMKDRVWREKRLTHEVVQFKRADGQRLTGLVNCQLYNNEKGQPMLNWTVLDISERMEFEERLQLKNEQLAKVNHQMEKFLYSTSHDLRSPLTTILGLVNLMRMEVKDKLVLDYVSKVETSASKLDKIIKDIMTFSRATYQRIKSERIDFEPLIWKVLNNYQSEPALRKINVEVKVLGDSHYYTDGERIEMILDNILRNSLHFYDANKARPFIKVNITTTDENAYLEFIDNGIGIGKQHLESIFTMFYKASHVSKGAGLGLFIVKETVVQLNGSVQVESEVGFGSVFRIALPNDPKGRLINRKLHLQQVANP